MIPNPKSEIYEAYSDIGEADRGLYSVEDYAEQHYWTFESSKQFRDATHSHIIGQDKWIVILSHGDFENTVMLVYWDDEHDCLNAECLHDGKPNYK